MSCEQGAHQSLLTLREVKEQKSTKGQRSIGKPHTQTQLICRESAHQTALADTLLGEDKEMLKVISWYKGGGGKVQYGDYWREKN